MRFAFLIMGDFDHTQDHSSIHQGAAQMIDVASIEEACAVARKLVAEGVDCIELCGAFCKQGAREVIAATEHNLLVGYVVHLPEKTSFLAPYLASSYVRWAIR